MNVVGIPFSNTSRKYNIARTKGTEKAPESIRRLRDHWQSKSVSFLNDSLEREGKLSFHEMVLVETPRFVKRLLMEEQIRMIAQVAFRKFGNERVAFLGGDNSVSYFLFSEFRRHYGENIFLITLDAHPDLCNKGKKIPYHSDWLRFAIERDHFPSERVLAIGWRDAERAEVDFANSYGLEYLPMCWIRKNGISALLKECAARLDKENNPPVYVSIDCDVFDPSIAPGVTTHSPFGMNQREAIELVKWLAQLPRLLAFDLVEIDPTRDINQITQILALKILGEFASTAG